MSSSTKPALTISTIITLSNGSRYIEGALNTVLGQSLLPKEIIVVDSGSSDDGPAIVSRMAGNHPITLLTQTTGGPSAARNFGVRHANGDLIAFLDHHDSWLQYHLEELISPFLERESRPLGWVYGDVDEIDTTGGLLRKSVLSASGAPHPKMDISDCLRQYMMVPLSASLVSRQAWESIGGMDETLYSCEDDDFFIRLLKMGYDNVFIGKALSNVRVDNKKNDAKRITESRMAYGRKLIASFSAEGIGPSDYVCSSIAPRFVRSAVNEVRRALRSHDQAWIDECMGNLRFFEGFLGSNTGSVLNCREPVISTIIPLFNGGEFIEEAIRSVLAQTLLPDEIIVVDDGSTDNGPALVERLTEAFPIRLIRQQNTGQSAARNVGVKLAYGDLISFLDQDDIWYPNHLAELVSPFREKRSVEIGWSYSDLDEVDRKGQMICHGVLTHFNLNHPKRDLVSCLSRDMFILPSATVVSRRAFEAVGGFDERLSGYEDDDLFLRLFCAGYDSVFHPTPTIKWRIFGTSSSHSSRMALSRALYATLLIERFPNNAEKSMYYATDVIAPRFLVSMLAEFRRAALRDDRKHQDRLIAQMEDIARNTRLGLRIRLRLFVLPALRLRGLTRLIIRYRMGLLRALGPLRK